MARYIDKWHSSLHIHLTSSTSPLLVREHLFDEKWAHLLCSIPLSTTWEHSTLHMHLLQYMFYHNRLFYEAQSKGVRFNRSMLPACTCTYWLRIMHVFSHLSKKRLDCNFVPPPNLMGCLAVLIVIVNFHENWSDKLYHWTALTHLTIGFFPLCDLVLSGLRLPCLPPVCLHTVSFLAQPRTSAPYYYLCQINNCWRSMTSKYSQMGPFIF